MKLTADGLTVQDADTVIVRGLSFTLHHGDCLIVRGPFEAHTTRLLRAFAGLDPVAAGRLTLAGRTTDEWGGPSWRTQVTYCPRTVPPLPGTPRGLHKALSQLGHGALSDAPSALVKRWGMAAGRLSHPWNELSTGEAQRALLALVLARDPAVVLLDAPTSAIEPSDTLQVEATLESTTRIWVAHDHAQEARLLGRGARVLELHADGTYTLDDAEA